MNFKKLVQATVDNPITQHNFYSVINSVMAENLLDVNVDNLTVVDRLLFIIKSRIEDISPELKLDDGTVINLNQVYNDVLSNISKNQATFEPFTLERNGLVIHLQLSNIKTENLINEEVYSKENYLYSSNDEVKDSLSKTFLNEIVKHITAIKIGDREVILSEFSFLDRLQLIETLPTNLLQECIDYIHSYKTILNESLVVEDNAIEIDAAFFSA